jgi:hypothetical protein
MNTQIAYAQEGASFLKGMLDEMNRNMEEKQAIERKQELIQEQRSYDRQAMQQQWLLNCVLEPPKDVCEKAIREVERNN